MTSLIGSRARSNLGQVGGPVALSGHAMATFGGIACWNPQSRFPATPSLHAPSLAGTHNPFSVLLPALTRKSMSSCVYATETRSGISGVCKKPLCREGDPIPDCLRGYWSSDLSAGVLVSLLGPPNPSVCFLWQCLSPSEVFDSPLRLSLFLGPSGDSELWPSQGYTWGLGGVSE